MEYSLEQALHEYKEMRKWYKMHPDRPCLAAQTDYIIAWLTELQERRRHESEALPNVRPGGWSGE